MFEKLGNKIKNFSLREFINRTFKVCFHKYEKKEAENKFGKFEFEQCICCHRTRNTKAVETGKKPEANIGYSKEREDRLKKLLD